MSVASPAESAAPVLPSAPEPAAPGASAPESETINAWPDESAESAMLSELRARGETASVASRARTSTEAVEETDTKNLPPLEDLVRQIPAEVREALDDLFRAKFVAVKRVPKQALKS